MNLVNIKNVSWHEKTGWGNFTFWISSLVSNNFFFKYFHISSHLTSNVSNENHMMGTFFARFAIWNGLQELALRKMKPYSRNWCSETYIKNVAVTKSTDLQISIKLIALLISEKSGISKMQTPNVFKKQYLGQGQGKTPCINILTKNVKLLKKL